MKEKTAFKALSFLPVIVMAIVILALSGQPGETSDALSEPFAKAETDFLQTRGFQVDKKLIHKLIRKAAHMAEYGLFALTVYIPIWVYKVRGSRQWWIMLCVSVAFAILDEFYQTFIPGRNGCVTDVLVDGAGVLCMIGVIWILKRLVVRTI